MNEIIAQKIIDWYVVNARDLPWRQEDTSAWGILVSEFMLQQTQVDRVIPRWLAWMERWQTPKALAAAPVQDAILAWDRLGYPRRALWLHRAATTITKDFGGQVPDQLEDLLSLTGVGEYTARAVSVFAHRQRHPVVDTNVRRVIARVRNGNADAGIPKLKADLVETGELLPTDPEQARTFSYGIMEFGAVMCTARSPRCDECPIRMHCAWAQNGFPEFLGARVAPQKKFEGSDRQARGKIMAILRAQPDKLHNPTALFANQTDSEQAERALKSLVNDGLIIQYPDANGTECYRLPG